MPTRGSPALSSCASGCAATKSISACTSRPSASGLSTSRCRRTRRSRADPRSGRCSRRRAAARRRSRRAPCRWRCSRRWCARSSSPGRRGRSAPSAPPGDLAAGKNDSTMFVPSNEVTELSRASAAGAASANPALRRATATAANRMRATIDESPRRRWRLATFRTARLYAIVRQPKPPHNAARSRFAPYNEANCTLAPQTRGHSPSEPGFRDRARPRRERPAARARAAARRSAPCSARRP